MTVLLEGDVIAVQRIVYPNDGEDGERFLDRVMTTAAEMVRKTDRALSPYVVIIVHCKLPEHLARETLRWNIQHGETLDDRLDAAFQMVDILYPGTAERAVRGRVSMTTLRRLEESRAAAICYAPAWGISGDTRFRYLGSSSSTVAEELINFTREYVRGD